MDGEGNDGHSDDMLGEHGNVSDSLFWRNRRENRILPSYVDYSPLAAARILFLPPSIQLSFSIEKLSSFWLA